MLAVWPSLSWLPPSLPLVVFWYFLVQSVLLVPPSGYLVVFATVRLSYLWHGVSWLVARVFLCFMATKASALCGLCSLHHAVGVFHVPFAAALRYSPSGDPESLRTPLKLYAPTLACAAFSLLPLLPSRASALSLFAGLRLPSSPRALALVGLVCPPRCPLSWLVFLAALLRGFGLVCSRGLVFVWLGLSGFSVCWCFGLFSLCRVLRLLASPDVSLDWDIRIFLSPAPLRP